MRKAVGTNARGEKSTTFLTESLNSRDPVLRPANLKLQVIYDYLQ